MSPCGLPLIWIFHHQPTVNEKINPSPRHRPLRRRIYQERPPPYQQQQQQPPVGIDWPSFFFLCFCFFCFFFLEGLFICFLIYLSSCPTGHDMSSERRRDFPYSFISIGLISPFICFCFVFLSPFLLFFLSCCCCYRGIFNWHAHH